MPIYEMTDSSISRIEETTFESVGIKEREDLQRLLRAQINIIAPDTLVLDEEFGDWENSRRRIDLLGLDKNGNLVVIEFKRTEDGGHMELQSLRYAAMVSAMTFEKAVEVHSDFLRRLGSEKDARENILEFLEQDEPDDDSFAQDVRIILASAEFSKELTTTVMWLNERGLDIRCVRIKPYKDGNRVLIDVQQVIPLPEAEEYTVRIREKEERERSARKVQSELDAILKRFWTELLVKARLKTNTFDHISPSTGSYLQAGAGRTGFVFVFAFGKTRSRVELYIDTGHKESNKAYFDTLFASKSEIESTFGGELGWERIDNKRASRIRADLSPIGVRHVERWPELQKEMIDAMVRLEKALAPRISSLS